MPTPPERTPRDAPAAPADQWSSHARQWSLLGPPLRPAMDDVRAVRDVVAAWQRERSAGAGPRALLLGVTPELAALPWPPGSSLVAVDRSRPMIDNVLPKQGAPAETRAVCADWRALPLADGSVDIAVGDGCFSVFAYPGEYRAFAAEVRRVLAPGGRFVIRVFAASGRRESVADVARDLGAGQIGNFHAFKWRLAMALQPSAERGVVLGDIHAAFREVCPEPAALAGRPGFEPEVVGTIEAYRGSHVAYTFPTLSELRTALSGLFEVAVVVPKPYELGERCPTLVLDPHGQRRSDRSRP